MGARRRLVITAAVAVVVLVAVEAGARLLEPSLPAPEQWADTATATKDAQLEARDCADVVFVGNSMARDALVPAVYTAHDPEHRSAYNAALDAAAPEQLDGWLDDHVVPALDPTVVVWAVGSMDLHRDSPVGRAARDAYLASVGGRRDLLGRLQRTLVDHVALARHRGALADPAALRAAVADRLAGHRADRADPDGIPGVLGPDGEGRSRRDLAYVADDPVTTGFVREQLLAGFAVDDDAVDQVRRTVDGLEARGITVVLVTLPVTDEFVALHPHSERDWEEYRAAMADLAAASGAPWLDLDDGSVPDGSFADTHHLNGAGADEVSEVVADRLAALDLPGATCPGSPS